MLKGLIGRKIGMTQIFDESGRAIPVTLLEAGPCFVSQIKNAETDGYSAVQLAFGETKPKRLSKAELGHLKTNNLPPVRVLREFRTKKLEDINLGIVGAHGQGTAQGCAAHLLGHGLGVIPGFWGVDATTANGLGRNHTAASGATSALLFPGLGTATTDFAAALGVVRAQAGIRHLALICLVHQVHIHFSCKNFIGQFDSIRLFAF